MSALAIGHLKETSDRAPWWLDVAGSLQIPLVNATTIPLTIEGVVGSYYLIDLEELNPQQFEKVCQHVVKRFDADIHVVRDTLRVSQVLPILKSELASVTAGEERS